MSTYAVVVNTPSVEYDNTATKARGRIFKRAIDGIHAKLGGSLNPATSDMVLVPRGVRATGTAKAGTVSADDTVTINGVAFTAKAAPTGDQYLAGAGAVPAASLAAAINASTTEGINGVVRASVSGDTVTVTCIYPGPIGNLITLARSANWTLGGLSGGKLSGGAFDSGAAPFIG